MIVSFKVSSFRKVVSMERLPTELERGLRVILRTSRDPSSRNREAVEARSPYDVTRELSRLGFVRYVEVSDEDMRVGYSSRIEATPYGRSYFSDRRRDTRARWAPVLVSAAIGVAGTLLGVIATLLLTQAGAR